MTSTSSDGAIVHFAGIEIQIDAKLRQRCAWCGAMLIDYDLDNIAVPEGQDPTPATWPVGALVFRDGSLAYTVKLLPDEPLPANACSRR